MVLLVESCEHKQCGSKPSPKNEAELSWFALAVGFERVGHEKKASLVVAELSQAFSKPHRRSNLLSVIDY